MTASILAASGPAWRAAGQITTTDFTDITGAVFIDLPGNNVLSPIHLGALTITPDHSWVNGAFYLWAPGSANDPAGGNGFLTSLTPSWDLKFLTLDFSEPLAAFGATFYHFPEWRNLCFSPAILNVYDGPNGSGTLLGSITSSGWLGGSGGNPDFVAVWSDSLNIRSATLESTGGDSSFAVDGYGVSFQPIKIVQIDIKPGSFANSINLKSNGKISVALLSTTDFDAPTEVEIDSLTFGQTGDEASAAFCNVEDVNQDGLLDLVCHFKTQLTGFQAGDTEGVLKGRTTAGIPIVGTDSVRIVR